MRETGKNARPLRESVWVRPHPWIVMICGCVLGLCTSVAPIAGVFTSSAIGTLQVTNGRIQTAILLTVLLVGFAVLPGALHSTGYWLIITETLAAALIPSRLVNGILKMPRTSWMFAIIFCAFGICAMVLDVDSVIPQIAAFPCAFFLGASVSRHMGMADARLLAWGTDGLTAVTRDLLLGRVTSGMLHDLAQPLNVISMANGNMEYIVGHLDIEEDERRQLLERVARIESNTQSAASILSLFRWFGRDGSDHTVGLTVRSALDRAVAATRSNVRHQGVAVELQGDALDCTLPERHGALEMMAVAALLCAFASYTAADGTRTKGKVTLHATLCPDHMIVKVHCVDVEGNPVASRPMDHATTWLVEQVAHEASGSFRCYARNSDPERFVMRLARDDA